MRLALNLRAWAIFPILSGLSACFVLQGCERDLSEPGKDPGDIIIPGTPSRWPSFFPREGHDYLYLTQKTYPTSSAPGTATCSLWISHARTPITTGISYDTVFRVHARRRCKAIDPFEQDTLSYPESDSTYFIVKSVFSSIIRDFDSVNSYVGQQTAPPFDVKTVENKTGKVLFYGDSLAIEGMTRNDLFLEGRGRVLYARTYSNPDVNGFFGFEKLRLLRYDSLQITDSLIDSYLNL